MPWTVVMEIEKQNLRRRGTMAGAPRPALCITEKWIRKRLDLQIDSLGSVRSLALPGGYNEKITHLGQSLIGFTKLKHLDLSRNAIESLQGLEHLRQLETLNLYYNSITSLKDIFLLRHNSKLKELDLRLNPVTRNEPDYRLFLIHMFVKLHKLDERGVVDSERRAALMHFSTEQAHKMEEGAQSVTALPLEDYKHLRLREGMVQSLAPCSALQDNSDALLELIGRSDHLTPIRRNSAACNSHITPQSSAATYTQYLHTSPTNSADLTKSSPANDSNERGDFKVNVNFTPAPQTNSVCTSEDKVVDIIEGGHTGENAGGETGISATNLTQLVELLQQYVSSDISFLNHDVRFKDAVSMLWEQTKGRKDIQRLEAELTTLRHQLGVERAILKDKATQLGELKTLLAQHSELHQSACQTEQVTQLLQQANTEILSLQQHVHTLQEENIRAKAALNKAPKPVQLTRLKDKIGQLESLKTSMEKMMSDNQQQQHREDHTKLHELTSMLQESHRSLVATNDHLLRELEVIKLKHSQEISQMHQNYLHLKKTFDMHVVHSHTMPPQDAFSSMH